VNAISGVRWVATLSPIMLLAGTFLTPVAGYEVPEFALAAVLIFLYLAAQLLRSDGLYLLSFSGLGVLLILEISPDGYFYSFAVTVAILVALDFVGIVQSLFGLTTWRGSPSARGESTPYLRIVADHLVRSLSVGACTLLLALVILSAPLPQFSFGNPVSSTGILALASLLLVLLAFSSSGQVRKWFRGRKAGPSIGV